MAFSAWWLSVVVYGMNAVASIALLAVGADRSVTNALVAFAMLLGGPLINFVCWYRPLYTAAKRSSRRHYRIFGVAYSLHIVATMLFFLGPPGWGGSTFIYSVVVFGGGGSVGAGVLCVVATGLFWVEAAVGIWVLYMVRRHYKTHVLPHTASTRDATGNSAATFLEEKESRAFPS
ncbi:scamp family-domain-containing protein [Zopfochytrium polystomum]|nr:scamp family-domain-containing protein [Zopfochytrium polystomum]